MVEVCDWCAYSKISMERHGSIVFSNSKTSLLRMASNIYCISFWEQASFNLPESSFMTETAIYSQSRIPSTEPADWTGERGMADGISKER